MSFAFNAAPVDNQSLNNETSSIQQKREAKFNKTIKRREPSSQVESLIQKIHSTNTLDDTIENFTPIPPPHSESVSKTIEKDKQRVNNGNSNGNNTTNINNTTNPNNMNVYEAFSQKGLNTAAADYYQQYIPTHYNKMSENTSGNRELLEKLNYMIHLLEEQQEEKTGHVTEEIILYSFLGVFIIFIIDSFARAGKYVR